MGLVETLIDNVSVKSVLILGPAMLLSWMLYSLVLLPIQEEINLAKMAGARPPRVRTFLPLSKETPPHLHLEQSEANKRT